MSWMKKKADEEEKPILSWDEYEIIMEEVRYRREHWKDFPEYDEYNEAPSEDFLFNELAQDYDFIQWQWEDLLDNLSLVIGEINPDGEWYAEMKNFGWRGIYGEKRFFANTGKEFLNQILPKTDCTFYIYRDGDHGLKINNFHHDSPVGKEWYHVRKAEARKD